MDAAVSADHRCYQMDGPRGDCGQERKPGMTQTAQPPPPTGRGGPPPTETRSEPGRSGWHSRLMPANESPASHRAGPWPWTDDTAMALPVFREPLMHARHLDSLEDALWATASAGGDVDTTGAAGGGIVAARTSTAALPAAWADAREPVPARTDGPAMR